MLRNNKKIGTTKLAKTVRVLPEEGTVLITLDGHDKIIFELADLNEEARQYSFTMESIYVRTIYEDDLNWGENGEAVTVNFYEAKTDNEYSAVTKTIKETKIFLSEFLLPYQNGMNALGATDLQPYELNKSNSIKIHKSFIVAKIAIYLDKKDNAEEINVIYTFIHKNI
jgi:hypothetical protein